MKTVIEMAIEAGFPFNKYGLLQGDDDNEIDADAMFERFAELVRADEQKKWQDQTAVEIHEAILDERENGQKWFDAVTAQHKQLILAEREAYAKAAEDFLTKGRSPLGQSVAVAIRARSST